MKRNRTPFITVIAFLLIGLAAEAFGQETYSVTAVGGPPQVLSGEIRWKKVFGTVPITMGLSAPDPDPCTAFFVIAVTADDDQTLLYHADKLTWKPKAGDFNICEYKMSVASNTPIRVYAGIGKLEGSTEQRDHLCMRAGWSGGEKIPYVPNRHGWNWGDTKGRIIHAGNLIDPQPDTGYKRGFLTNRHDVTLSPVKPMFIRFEMAYVMNRSQHISFTKPAPPAPKPPYITASPVIIPAPGWPFGTVHLGWDSGPENPNVEVWVSVNNGPETPAFSIDFPPGHLLFKQPKAAFEMKLPRNTGFYKYILKAAGKTLSSVSFYVP